MIRDAQDHDAQDHDEVEAFCRDAWPRLVAGLVVWCDSRAVAEELAQETLVRVWERWSQVAETRDPDAWMWRVAINLSRSSWRRSMAERRALRRAGGLRVRVPEAPTALDEDLLAAVRSLPERQRRAVVLRHVVDLPVAVVAEAMGCADGTVRALTHQGLERLRSGPWSVGPQSEEVAHDG
ncbi:MAG: sigma-70 family RNA polymerase sigma factor [Acidimicrobiales bacterium]|nr:sigma-70 family RNA polymerase sigma factor [Acidimicrobiales bacterium]